MTDTISDMITRIRNAKAIKNQHVDVPSSKIKLSILKILKDEGFIKEFKEVKDESQNVVRVYLKYGPLKQQILNSLEKVSKPSRRIYKKAEEVAKVRGGIGIAIYSTNKGILSDKECRKLKVGGELLCVVI